MNNLVQILCGNFQSNQQSQNNLHRSYNSSRGFSTGKKVRNSIFKMNKKNIFSTSKSNMKYNNFQEANRQSSIILNRKLFEQNLLINQQKNQHIKIRMIISDDYCGCQNTLTLCQRLNKTYFKQIRILQLKQQYQKGYTIQNPLTKQIKRQFFKSLPKNYPQIFITQIQNILNNLQNHEVTNNNFRCLAWIHFHCKLQYISFFFFNDLKKSLNNKNQFYDTLQLLLIRENIDLNKQIKLYQQMDFRFINFIWEYYQSGGSNIIPLSQYAKFLVLINQKGLSILIKLIVLFISKKKSQLYQILKLWSNKQYHNLLSYSRQLNWDVFYQQLKIMK